MLSKWKVAVVTGLFVLSALSFFLGLFPILAEVFWILWFIGCGACILALVLTVIVPTHHSAVNAAAAGSSAPGPAAGSGGGVSRP